MLPKIGSYGKYSSDNYGVNTLYVEIGPLTIWFSYKTPVAFQIVGNPRVIRENTFSKTTGKHLNWIGHDRVSNDQFEAKWEKEVVPVLKRLLRKAA
jgi:hypothetical protein